MKASWLLTVVLLMKLPVLACPACKRQQPRLLQGITHGTGPESRWDYVIVCVALALTVLALYYSVKWLIRPGEQAPGHIKQFILNNE
ncbi:hypothetical protein A4H97_12145 [Niastella yeongjuensis]|uniref:Uncharacterized protein n=1 Tax=Niastella yeongjuensis TaxID=354355 RepID=A0A1V9E9U2_9BACT|nr:hypothetical protein [Niastella yeongjuensis]OQP42897.1 hypothetical protein A4H97_12145 [Niastella yeongjuensis]SEO58630.1 hypothetical protein SAMN05660816_03096 [Niastella yeongjuensis]